MHSSRHIHPHLDPRQPRQGSRPGTNPPVFAWKPEEHHARFHLIVACDPELTQPILDLADLTEPVYLPEQALPCGRYYWTWSAGADQGERFDFEITPESIIVEVPPVSVWLERFSATHPRLYVQEAALPQRRATLPQIRPEMWCKLTLSAQDVLNEEHEIPEPPFLPNMDDDYERWFSIWYDILWSSRHFVKGAETMALVYLLTGDVRYGQAACQRMASISHWDADGSSEVNHNSEAHMSVIWDGPMACDWAWDQFTDEQRERVIAQFRRRGQNQFNQLRHQGYFGVTRFDSHSSRKIVFLAMTALVFHEHVPEAREWLEWLRPVLCGIWPIWADDDGAWAQGISYSQAYVTIMTLFVTALKQGAGVDLYQRPFWRNHLRWRQYCYPPYAEWIGFGDHSERWASGWLANADLSELIARETGVSDLADYIADFRAGAAQSAAHEQRDLPGILSHLFLLSDEKQADLPSQESLPALRLFPGAGWGAVRTDLENPNQDLALIFRSSRYGSISHSHANNNDFALHVAGQVMAMPTGYYDGYGSNHHAHWVWHTKSHNCVTLSDAPQIMRSPDSTGAVGQGFEDSRLIYFRGTADASYQDRATRCRRHVLYLKNSHCFVMVDEFVARPELVSALQWNIHSWNQFVVDEAARQFTLKREKSQLDGFFLYHHNSFFSLTEGWDPPPIPKKANDQWFHQYHLRFTTSGFDPVRNLGVVLRPSHPGLPPTPVATSRIGDTESAQIGSDLVLINQGQGINTPDIRSDKLVVLEVSGCRYEVDDFGIQMIG